MLSLVRDVPSLEGDATDMHTEPGKKAIGRQDSVLREPAALGTSGCKGGHKVCHLVATANSQLCSHLKSEHELQVREHICAIPQGLGRNEPCSLQGPPEPRPRGL